MRNTCLALSDRTRSGRRCDLSVCKVGIESRRKQRAPRVPAFVRRPTLGRRTSKGSCWPWYRSSTKSDQQQQCRSHTPVPFEVVTLHCGATEVCVCESVCGGACGRKQDKSTQKKKKKKGVCGGGGGGRGVGGTIIDKTNWTGSYRPRPPLQRKKKKKE